VAAHGSELPATALRLRVSSYRISRLRRWLDRTINNYCKEAL
jgi:hypothetical protein